MNDPFVWLLVIGFMMASVAVAASTIALITLL